MGLDSVELVLAVEEEFGIAIDDADAANLTTPRLLADYVFARLGNAEAAGGRCLSQAGFYRLRAVLIERFGAHRGEVRPDSSIRDFLRGDIRTQWRELKQAIDATQLPRLECRQCIAYPLLWGMPPLGAALAHYGGAPAWAVLGVAFSIWLAAVALTERIADLVPEALRTLAALTPYVRVGQPAQWPREDVLQRVLQVVSLHLGIALADIHPDHRFVEDLGVD